MSRKQDEYWRILYIEDDEEDYILIRNWLTKSQVRKIDLTWAASYEEGVLRLGDAHYDAVLVDYDLGSNTGLELIRRISGGYSAPLILYTGRGSHKVDLEAMEAGATLYLTKNEVNPLLLERSIRYAIEIKQKENELRISREILEQELAERKQAEEALRLSEEKYRNLFNSIDEGFFLIDLIYDDQNNPVDMFYVEANAASIKMLGKDFTGRRLSEISPNYEPYWYEIFGEVAKTGKSVRQERYAEPDGKWYDFYVFKVGNADSCRVGNIFLDISERKRREDITIFLQGIGEDIYALATPEEIFTTVGGKIARYYGIDSGLSFCEINEDKDEISVSYDYDPQGMREAVGRHRLSDYVSPGLLQEIKNGRVIMVEDIRTDARTTTESGAHLSWGVCSLLLAPFQTETRDVFVISVQHNHPHTWRQDEIELLQELSARICRCFELARAEAALRESETRFRTMANGTPVIIWVTDASGRIEFINQAYCDYFGVNLEQVQSKGWEPLVHPDTIDYIDLFGESMRKKLPFRAETRTLRKDGQWRWITSHAQPRFSESGEFLGMAGSSMDINDHKQAEENLQHYTRELELTNNALRDFTFFASHDLQEPLRKVKAFGQILKNRSKKELGDEGKDTVDRMTSAVERMSAMLQGLLIYTRLSSHAEPFVLVDLQKVVAEVLLDLEVRIHQTRGNIEIGELPAVIGDPFQLRLLFQNLIGNALKYHQPGLLPLVSITGQANGGKQVEIRVKDNGIGFDMAEADRLFEPFRRLHSQSEYEGTGMGLAICMKIVKRHGGKITASSVPGQGSTFRVYLPAQE